MSGEPGRESVTVTNDGATILKSIGVDNPASKVLVDMSMSQVRRRHHAMHSWRFSCYRTMKWAMVQRALRCSPPSCCARQRSWSSRRCIRRRSLPVGVMRHRYIVVLRLSSHKFSHAQVALEALDREASESVTDEKQLYDELMKIAKTVLSSKILGQHSDHFAKLAVDAVMRLKVRLHFGIL